MTIRIPAHTRIQPDFQVSYKISVHALICPKFRGFCYRGSCPMGISPKHFVSGDFVIEYFKDCFILGILSYPVLILGDFVSGDSVLRVFVQMRFFPRGLSPKGFCPGGICPKSKIRPF